jgi:hypothetical protein
VRPSFSSREDLDAIYWQVLPVEQQIYPLGIAPVFEDGFFHSVSTDHAVAGNISGSNGASGSNLSASRANTAAQAPQHHPQSFAPSLAPWSTDTDPSVGMMEPLAAHIAELTSILLFNRFAALFQLQPPAIGVDPRLTYNSQQYQQPQQQQDPQYPQY